MIWLPRILGALAAFLASWAIVRAWIDFSQRANLVDVPNDRSSHTRVTPRGGGVGIVIATIAGMGVAVLARHAGDLIDAAWAGALALFIAAISFLDDVRSLRPGLRLVLHLSAAAAATVKLGAFSVIAIPFFGTLTLPVWAATLLTVVWITGLTNVYNFMDGIDGIAGAQGVVAGLAWAWFGSAAGDRFVLWCGLTLAAACAGFLVHNISPAKVFMGDVGSAFLGFAFALLPLLALHGRIPVDEANLRIAGAVPVFAGLVVWPFVADGAYTFFRRVFRGENVLNAHRSHLYQRLTIADWKHTPVTRLYLVWAALSSVLGAVYLFANDTGRTAILVAALASLGAIHVLVRREEQHAAKENAAVSQTIRR